MNSKEIAKKSIQELKTLEGVPSIVFIPQYINRLIEEYQELDRQLYGGRKMTKPDIILGVLAKAAPDLEIEIQKLRQKVEAKQ